MLLRIYLLVLVVGVFSACGSGNKDKSNSEYYKSIGLQIREERLARGISQQELANAVGISQNGLSLIEDGLATPIHTKIIAIQNYFGVEFEVDQDHTHIEAYMKK